jgi:hypothetical protein
VEIILMAKETPARPPSKKNIIMLVRQQGATYILALCKCSRKRRRRQVKMKAFVVNGERYTRKTAKLRGDHTGGKTVILADVPATSPRPLRRPPSPELSPVPYQPVATGLITPTIYMVYPQEAENVKFHNQRSYARLVSQLSRGLVQSKESERSSANAHHHEVYKLVVCEERGDLCACFKAIRGVKETQVEELVRQLRMSIWLEEEDLRSPEEVMENVFWKRTETTPRHEAWVAFSNSTGEGIVQEEV